MTNACFPSVGKGARGRGAKSNDSPDIGFNSSINPYRGCEHGCVYPYVTQSLEAPVTSDFRQGPDARFRP